MSLYLVIHLSLAEAAAQLNRLAQPYALLGSGSLRQRQPPGENRVSVKPNFVLCPRESACEWPLVLRSRTAQECALVLGAEPRLSLKAILSYLFGQGALTPLARERRKRAVAALQTALAPAGGLGLHGDVDARRALAAIREDNYSRSAAAQERGNARLRAELGLLAGLDDHFDPAGVRRRKAIRQAWRTSQRFRRGLRAWGVAELKREWRALVKQLHATFRRNAVAVRVIVYRLPPDKAITSHADVPVPAWWWLALRLWRQGQTAFEIAEILRIEHNVNVLPATVTRAIVELRGHLGTSWVPVRKRHAPR